MDEALSRLEDLHQRVTEASHELKDVCTTAELTSRNVAALANTCADLRRQVERGRGGWLAAKTNTAPGSWLTARLESAHRFAWASTDLGKRKSFMLPLSSVFPIQVDGAAKDRQAIQRSVEKAAGEAEAAARLAATAATGMQALEECQGGLQEEVRVMCQRPGMWRCGKACMGGFVWR